MEGEIQREEEQAILEEPRHWRDHLEEAQPLLTFLLMSLLMSLLALLQCGSGMYIKNEC